MKDLTLNCFSNIVPSVERVKGIGDSVVLKPSINIFENFIEAEKEKIINFFINSIVNICEIGCVICIIVCGLSILWYVIDQKGNTPKKYISGSFVFYLGMRLVQYVVK